MNYTGPDIARIVSEYERRAVELPADYYSLCKPANLMMHQDAVAGCLRMLNGASVFPLAGKHIADIGCGDGSWLLEFMRWGADPAALSGVDLSARRIAVARERMPNADLRQGSASELPWRDQAFDLVTQFTVFTSILDSELKRAVANEMLRILKPGGSILWFDFRVDNPRNAQVRGIPAREIRALFPECSIRLASEMLAPPIARTVAGWSRPLAAALRGLPFLRTHYVGLIQKRRLLCGRL
jgi:ubiquinone/menaquinone biosynthesis C-methylase UbiE